MIVFVGGLKVNSGICVKYGRCLDKRKE